MKLGNWLRTTLGLTAEQSDEDSDNGQSAVEQHILKLRFFADGRFTLNGQTIKFADLKPAAKTAAANGGVVWIWSEGELSDAGSEVIKELLDGVNLRVAFGNDENFSGMPLPEQGDDARPSNACIYNSKEELLQFANNETELYVYLSSLQLLFDVYRSDNPEADKDDAGVFHIAGAIRPNASKFWFLHPGVHDDEYYRPLVESLERQPLPTVREGVLAFLISNKRPLESDERPQFEIVAPDEWTEVPRRLGKDMSITEILDVVWPAATK